ncbi:MAG: hypothetical protein JJU45_19900 [Acidimicrobiia bacterium]|nr:hypothetical protein [Acidimicrobiia bacterium]MCC5954359.1 hypothetical protein [Acidimicrobiia bacterium]
MANKGKWQQGIVPRNFHWIIKDQLAVCERPGGYAQNHRRVRRQEEIIWVREQGFTAVVSLIPAPHNLHNYDELGVAWRHWPFDTGDDPTPFLAGHFPQLADLLAAGAKLLVHNEELGDSVCGFMCGYLLWAGLVDNGPDAITVIERMVQRELGPFGRELVTIAGRLAAGP